MVTRDLAADRATRPEPEEPAPELRRPRGRRLQRLGRRGLRGSRRLLRWLAVPWRRSLRLRVLVTTLVLSSAVTAFVGWMLFQQVRDDLIDDKVSASLSEAAAGIRAAQEQIDAAEPTGSTGEFLTQLTQDVALRGTFAGVLLESGRQDQMTDVRAPRGAGEILPSSVPDELREAFPSGRIAWRYTSIRWQGGGSEPGVAVGGELYGVSPGDSYQLYYLFPFTQEGETLRVVQRALLAAGAVLVLLLGAVAWLVTSQVVTPVRSARRIAERFAAGRLEERMRVKGEDDLARLAGSFNQMAASLQRQIRQLEELSRVQRRFVSDVSHELRTPLTTVRMASDVLHEARTDFPATVARAAELLQTELNRFEALLADLLEISRHDAGAASLSIEEVDLRDLARRAVGQARALANRKGSRMYLHVPVVDCTAQIDSRRIERVVRNLVVNAVEYGEGQDIVVRVVADASAVAVSVRDHGVGLNPGEAAMVFDRFWRADPARSRTTGGTGLGLAISLEDALLHGGWLQAWGEPGRGSHFRLTLPRRQGERLEHSPVPLVADGATEVAAPAMEPVET